MENYSYGRITTLNRLKAARDDGQRHPFRRMQADKAIRKIVEQLRDRKLMRLRERLIKATLYGDTHAQWLIEREMLAYEGRFDEIDAVEYSAFEEDY